MRSATRAFRLAAVIAATAASLTTASTASAQKWYAKLAPEAPGATGSGFAFFSLSGSTLSINADWSGLTGTTTVAHIHCCTALPNTGVVGVAVTPGTLTEFPAGVQSGSYNRMFDLTQPTTFTATFVDNFAGGILGDAQAALTTAFGNDRAYLNIHSKVFAGGEIRGFIREVPEPSALLLTMLAMALLGAVAIRRGVH